MSQIPEPSSGDLAHAKPMPHWPKLAIRLQPERTKEKTSRCVSGQRLDQRGVGGYTLVVWKLDCLGRSLPYLLDIVTGLRDGGEADMVDDLLPSSLKNWTRSLPPLDSDTSKAAVCRTFDIPRSTLIDALARVGWTGPGSTR